MNLPALAVALLLVTTVTVVSLGMADRAFVAGERDADQRRVAVALSERFVGAESPLTARQNVFAADKIEGVNASELRTLFPVVGDRDVRVRLGDRTLVDAGDSTGGTTIRRIVLVEERESVTLDPDLSASDPELTLPRRSSSADIALNPSDGTTVTAVRANDRVVLRNESGLSGEFEIDLSGFETTTLSFESDGALSAGSVEVTYYPTETRKEMVAVTVDE